MWSILGVCLRISCQVHGTCLGWHLIPKQKLSRNNKAVCCFFISEILLGICMVQYENPCKSTTRKYIFNYILCHFGENCCMAIAWQWVFCLLPIWETELCILRVGSLRNSLKRRQSHWAFRLCFGHTHTLLQWVLPGFRNRANRISTGTSLDGIWICPASIFRSQLLDVGWVYTGPRKRRVCSCLRWGFAKPCISHRGQGVFFALHNGANWAVCIEYNKQ